MARTTSRPAPDARIVVIGGGGTGGAILHDLTLRGFRAVLIERGELTSGTTGRHHGQLHSGARYAVTDPEAAVECIEESRILRRIARGALELNDGLFVAVNAREEAFLERFLASCGACGIPTRVLSAVQALALEPRLSTSVRRAVQVPDGTIDAFRLPLMFFATARHGGADIRTFTEVIGLVRAADRVRAVRVRDHRTDRERKIGCDLVVNAAGAWAGSVASLAGVKVQVQPVPGVMVAVKGRLVNMVVSRLDLPGDADIVVPQRNLSAVGTTAWLSDDPDEVDCPREHVRLILEKGAEMVPGILEAPIRAAWAAARPLVGGDGRQDGRELSRTFRCFDHGSRDGLEGLVSVTGGKATTLRGMAETVTDLVCRKLGVDIPCTTGDTVLLPYRSCFKAG